MRSKINGVNTSKLVKIYSDAGFITIPLKFGTKLPQDAGYQYQRTSSVLDPFTNNVGLLLSPSRILAIDADNIEDMRKVLYYVDKETGEEVDMYEECRSRSLIRRSPAKGREMLLMRIPESFDAEDMLSVDYGSVGSIYCISSLKKKEGASHRPSRQIVLPPSTHDKHYGDMHFVKLLDGGGEKVLDAYDIEGTKGVVEEMGFAPTLLCSRLKVLATRKLSSAHRKVIDNTSVYPVDDWIGAVNLWLESSSNTFLDMAIDRGYTVDSIGDLVHPSSSSGNAGLKYYSSDDKWINFSGSDETFPLHSGQCRPANMADFIIADVIGGGCESFEVAKTSICNGTYDADLKEFIDSQLSPDSDEDIEDSIKGSSEPIDPFEATHVVSEVLPDSIIFPDNLRGRLARYYYSKSVVYNKVAAHVAARITLSFLGGKMCSMDLQGRSARPNMFAQLIGLPGSGKEIIQNGIEGFLLEIGNSTNCDPTLRTIVENVTNENGSAQGLMDMFDELEHRPDMLHIEDESGGTSSQVGKGNKTVEDLFTFRLKQFSAKTKHKRRLRKEKGKDKEKAKQLYGQSFTWVGATTPSNVKRSSSFLVSSGAVSRVLYYSMEPYTEEPVTDVKVMVKKAKDLKFSDMEFNQLVADIEDYADQQYFPNTFEKNESRNQTYYARVKNSIEVPMTENAYARVLKLNAWRLSLPEFEQNVWARYAEYCVKLAVVEARCQDGVEFTTPSGGVGSSPMKAVATSGAGTPQVSLNSITHNMIITESMIIEASKEVSACLRYSQEMFKVMAQEENDNMSVQSRYREVEHVLVTKLLSLNTSAQGTEGTKMAKIASTRGGVTNYGVATSALTMIEVYKSASINDKRQIRDFLGTSQHLLIKKLSKAKAKENANTSGKKPTAYYLRECGPNLTHIIRRRPSSKTVFEVVELSRDGETIRVGGKGRGKTSSNGSNTFKLPKTVKKGFKAVDHVKVHNP